VAAPLDAPTSPVLIIGGTVDEDNGCNNAVRLAERLNARYGPLPKKACPGFLETHPLYRALHRQPLDRCARSSKATT
jgi:benzoylformate decarboxylase